MADNAGGGGGPKPTFWIIMAVLVVGLGYLGFSRMAKKGSGPGGTLSDQEMAAVKGAVEAPDANNATKGYSNPSDGLVVVPMLASPRAGLLKKTASK